MEYQKPEMHMVAFEAEDVITASGLGEGVEGDTDIEF